MFITTANYLPDKKIIKTFHPINTTIALGLNVFGDFASSVTDFFGGRSSNYENRMNAMFEQAKSNISDQLKSLNANGLIGFSVDYNEISAKDKGMLMLSIYGTPVVIENLDKETTDLGSIDAEYFAQKLYAKTILKSYNINSSQLRLPKADFDFIISSRLEELNDFVIALAMMERVSIVVDNTALAMNLKDLLKYYDGFPESTAKKILYGIISKKDISRSLLIDFMEKIVLFKLVDYKELLKGIKASKFPDTIKYFELALFSPSHFVKTDIAPLKEILSICTVVKDELTADIVKEKVLLMATDKWICNICKTKNMMSQEKCTQCLRYKGGFLSYNKSVSVLINDLTTRIEVLEDIFCERS